MASGYIAKLLDAIDSVFQLHAKFVYHGQAFALQLDLVAELRGSIHDGLDAVIHGQLQELHVLVYTSLDGIVGPDEFFARHSLAEQFLFEVVLQRLEAPDFALQLLHLVYCVHVCVH